MKPPMKLIEEYFFPDPVHIRHPGSMEVVTRMLSQKILNFSMCMLGCKVASWRQLSDKASFRSREHYRLDPSNVRMMLYTFQADPAKRFLRMYM
jgi:hypothetical protein